MFTIAMGVILGFLGICAIIAVYNLAEGHWTTIFEWVLTIIGLLFLIARKMQ